MINFAAKIKKGNIMLMTVPNEITPALRRKIKKARQDFLEGKCIECGTPEELENYFNSL